MALDETQIGQVREAAALLTFAEAEDYCALLNATEEAQMAEYLDDWALVRRKFIKVEGGKLGVTVDKSIDRLAIRNDIRRLIGLLPLTSDTELSGIQSAPAFATGVTTTSCESCSLYEDERIS